PQTDQKTRSPKTRKGKRSDDSHHQRANANRSNNVQPDSRLPPPTSGAFTQFVRLPNFPKGSANGNGATRDVPAPCGATGAEKTAPKKSKREVQIGNHPLPTSSRRWTLECWPPRLLAPGYRSVPISL